MKIKIKKLPPAPQTTFFQESQFDKGIGPGTDPVRFLQGKTKDFGSKERQARNANVGLANSKKKKLRKAEKALEGHDNKDAIMKILRSE